MTFFFFFFLTTLPCHTTRRPTVPPAVRWILKGLKIKQFILPLSGTRIKNICISIYHLWDCWNLSWHLMPKVSVMTSTYDTILLDTQY